MSIRIYKRSKLVDRGNKRNTKGQIVEAGPALWILLLFFAFPMLDLMMLSLLYSTCWYVNYTVADQVARGRVGAAGNGSTAGINTSVATSIDAVINSSGLLAIIGMKSPPGITSNISYPNGQTPPAGQPYMIEVTTSMTAKPWLPLPWFTSVPGLNAPIPLSVSTLVPRESSL